jgi:hypothetical protein
MESGSAGSAMWRRVARARPSSASRAPAVSLRYRDGTLILETEFETEEGSPSIKRMVIAW